MGKNYKILFYSLVILIGLGSCSEPVKPTPYTYSKIFTGENSKTWQVKFVEETLNDKVISTFTVGCAVDDRYTFRANTDHTFEVNTGKTKCATDELSLYSDTWTFNNATATLTMILPFLSDSVLPFIVLEAREGKMEVEIYFDDAKTGSYRIHFESTTED